MESHRTGRSFALSLAVLAAMCMSLGFAQNAPSAATDARHVVFTEYPDFSRSLEVSRRTLTPLANAAIARAASGAALREQAIDLNTETFTVFVPRKRPIKGYGVLVFIPPWQDARLPAGWGAGLDEAGVIFVCASKVGNGESIIDRRMPLALLGAYNLMLRFPIDADRVYVGGFSGGARVAMRLALAYPDVFRGALLNAGSDPIGDREAALPPDDLFAQFQNDSRVIYVTGSDDSVNISSDMGSRASLNAWCVFGTEVETMYRMGHEIASGTYLREALSLLDRRPKIDIGKIESCRARIAKHMADDLDQVEQLLEHDERHDAQRMLEKIDARYSGLASREIVEFEHRLGER